jgi:cell division protein FtsQ
MTSGGGRNWRLVRADTDAVPSSVRRFMARARRRRIVYGTAVMGVRDVQVTGTDILTPLQVQQAAAVPMKQPLARVDLDKVRARVQGLAAVDRAEVSRSWPGTIRVEVVERRPVMAVPTGKQQWTLVDAGGMAYRTVSRVPAGLPLAKLAAPGPADVNTRSALTVLTALTDELRQQLLGISVKAPAQIKLVLRSDRIVVWGDDTESATKAQVATALLKRKGDTIDVSAPDVVTIR